MALLLMLSVPALVVAADAVKKDSLAGASGSERADVGKIGPAVLETQVVEFSPEQAMVGLAAGGTAGVQVDDAFWVLDETGVIGRGEVFFVTQDRCAGRWAGLSTTAPAKGQKVVILRHAAMPTLRDLMPPGATVAGTLLSVAPGRQSAWMDIDAVAGLRAGDQVLVSRKGLPISRGRIAQLDRETALATLQPLVRNASPEPGDHVELWPAPADARWGRLNSTLLDVKPGSPDALEGAEIVFPVTEGDGLAVDRLVEVFHGRRYIGLARIVAITPPLSRANMIKVATLPRDCLTGKEPACADQLAPRTDPAVGDRAVVRASPDQPAGPLTAAVFRIEPDYCLIATGELDGIKTGEQFLVRRQDPNEPSIWHEVAMLTIEHLQPVDSGASIKPLTSQVEGLKVWDMAERQLPGGEQWRAGGIVESADEASRTAVASIEPNSKVAAGGVVRWVPEQDGPPGGAVVLRHEGDRLILHVPAGWGDMKQVPRARIDLRQTTEKNG
jgi:hypothetical protein